MTTERRYHTIFTPQALDLLLNTLGQLDTFALDLETTGLNPRQDQIVGLSFAPRIGEGYYLPIRHNEPGQMKADQVLASLKPLLEGLKDRKKHVAVHNPKFDTAFLRAEGIVVPDSQVHDTMLETYALATGNPRLGLKDVAGTRYGDPMTTFESLFGPEDTEKNIANIPIHMASDYACQDADYCLRLHEDTYPQVKDGFTYNLENNLWPIFRDVEAGGVGFDPEAFRMHTADLLGAADQIFELSEQVRTPQNMRAAERLDKFLKDLNANNPLNYLSDDGRVRPEYRQVATQAGQCVMENPSLDLVMRPHSFSMDTPSGGRATMFQWQPGRAVISGASTYFVEVSLNQPEVALLAQAAGDTGAMQGYRECGDMHTQVAAEAQDIQHSDVRPQERSIAKWDGYAELYGPDRPCEECIYPNIRRYLQDALAPQCKSNGTIETQFGRTIKLPEVQPEIGRMAMLYAKGTASDYSKLALLELSQAVEASFSNRDVKLVAFTGDKSLWEVSQQIKPWDLARVFKGRLEPVVNPVATTIRIGRNWGDMEEIR